MRYIKVTLTTALENIEPLTQELLELGVGGYEIIDGLPNEFISEPVYEELRPLLTDMHGRASVIFYMEDNRSGGEETDRIVKQIQKAPYELDIQRGFSDESDWRDKWKDFFHSFRIGDILVKPSWEEAEVKPGETVIEIDPGNSFGTGSHETTRMCMEAIADSEISGSKTLDMGCGSGILSILAKKRGAQELYCVDIDPDCIETTKENLSKNGCSLEGFNFVTGDIISDEESLKKIPDDYFDFLFANILADVIVLMLPLLKGKLKKGSTLIFSGIIEGKEAKVKEAMEKHGIALVLEKKDGEWFMLKGIKN